MNKRIAILRGINVGGRRKILMADLKKLFHALGFAAVQTYIQSGNVIFNSTGKEDNITIAANIEQAIAKKYGFDVPVIVRTVGQWQEAIASNPFFKKKDADVERLHLTFLKEVPEPDKLEVIQAFDYSPDKFELVDNNIFVFCSGKYSDSKLSNTFFESKLKQPATTRNWKTVLKLMELSGKD